MTDDILLGTWEAAEPELEPEPAPSRNVWRHDDGRVRRTRPGNYADQRYARLNGWTRQ